MWKLMKDAPVEAKDQLFERAMQKGWFWLSSHIEGKLSEAGFPSAKVHRYVYDMETVEFGCEGRFYDYSEALQTVTVKLPDYCSERRDDLYSLLKPVFLEIRDWFDLDKTKEHLLVKDGWMWDTEKQSWFKLGTGLSC